MGRGRVGVEAHLPEGGILRARRCVRGWEDGWDGSRRLGAHGVTGFRFADGVRLFTEERKIERSLGNRYTRTL